LTQGVFTWVDNRPSGIKGISGLASENCSPPISMPWHSRHPMPTRFTMVDVSAFVICPAVIVPFTVALGPKYSRGIEASAAGTKRLQDLYVGSILQLT